TVETFHHAHQCVNNLPTTAARRYGPDSLLVELATGARGWVSLIRVPATPVRAGRLLGYVERHGTYP
ncbi:MAG TPA: hypothetical protein VFW27_00115, partial [Actinoplanes sp.]|nr:hypothetical protein [Actinoplanes sp.]